MADEPLTHVHFLFAVLDDRTDVTLEPLILLALDALAAEIGV